MVPIHMDSREIGQLPISNTKGKPLWAITTYFDPTGCRNRLRAYREFRRHLHVPLVTVELSYGSAFDLATDDADVLIQLRGGAVLWQKERLLNIALEALPSHCVAVAWLDCDVVFARADWSAAALGLLDGFAMIQPFSRLHYLNQNEAPETIATDERLEVFESIALRMAQGNQPAESFRVAGSSRKLRYVPGGVWVARRELLAACGGFYDAAILGAGDKLMLGAGCGRQTDVAHSVQMNTKQWAHFQPWADRFFRAVNGRISYLSGDLFHLWHGDLASRRYAQRYEGFSRFEFDPSVDIAVSRNGAWQWNSDKPELHAHARRLFANLVEPAAASLLSGESTAS